MSCAQLLPSVVHGTWLLKNIRAPQACYVPTAFTAMHCPWLRSCFRGSRAIISRASEAIAAYIGVWPASSTSRTILSRASVPHTMRPICCAEQIAAIQRNPPSLSRFDHTMMGAPRTHNLFDRLHGPSLDDPQTVQHQARIVQGPLIVEHFGTATYTASNQLSAPSG